MSDGMLSTHEAGQRLGLTDSSIRRLILAGHLRAVKRGRDWWVPADALADVTRRPVGRPPNLSANPSTNEQGAP
jgi:excisionase family DNA binding protein